MKIILRYKNKILLLRLPDGRIDFPGGRMEWGESIFGALKRELKEEINYNLKEEPELFGVWNCISKNKKRHSVMINFIYELNKKPKIVSREKAKILWASKKEIISKNIIKDKNFVEKIFSWRPSKNGSKRITKEN